MFIDELTVSIHSGKGGDGIVSWMHFKGIDHAGPGGGNGGKGGDVYLRGVRDIGLLSKYRFIKDFKAEDGKNGSKNCMHGKAGDDLVIDLPIGTVLTNIETGDFVEVMDETPMFFLKGGNRGYGNAYFKGPKNINPKESTPGKPAQGGTYKIELKLVVDLGMVGFPNAGKSSLLNSLTKAKAKVGSYQFTTIAPNLGDLYGFVIADIPGLIEGASEGKGLGHNFLRHISRTKALLHCISAENAEPVKDYELIRDELRKYDIALLDKPEIILVTKTDTIDEKSLKKVVTALKKKNKDVLTVSILDDSLVKQLSDELVKMLRKM
jgi:GTP-binding protein